MNYLIVGLVTFVTVFLKGFQYKNVIGGHLKLVAVTSYAMAFCDVILVGFIVKLGWQVAFASGTGAAIGMVASVVLHDRIFGGTK